jgi:hypothetical protein
VGLDELNQLGEKPLSTLIAIALILGIIAVIWQNWRQIKKDRMEFEERRVTLDSTKESVNALASAVLFLKTVSEDVGTLAKQTQASFDAAHQTMRDVTTRREADFEKGVNTLRADIGFVPGKVGNITEGQIDTIRTALAALLAEQEVRMKELIDELGDRYSVATLDTVRAEFKSMTDRFNQKIEELTEVVPEKVSQAVLKRGQATDDTLADTQHALKTSEQRAAQQANQIDQLRRGTGPLTDTAAKPPADDGHGSKE